MTADEVVFEVVRAGGLFRTSVLGDRGHRAGDVRAAVASGRLHRPVRGWVAVPNADPVAVQAVRSGVVISCVSQALRLGLWVHDTTSKVLHVAAAPGAAVRRTPEMKVHWFQPSVPRHPDAVADPIVNVLAAVAACEPFEQALATWESAMNKDLITLAELRRFRWKPKARRLLDTAMPFADAGLETYLRIRLGWLRLPITVQTWIAGHRVDVLIGSRLVVQIDGGHHVGAQRSEDIRHDAELRLRGYHVIRVAYHQVIERWEYVQDLIMRAVAQGLHRAA